MEYVEIEKWLSVNIDFIVLEQLSDFQYMTVSIDILPFIVLFQVFEALKRLQINMVEDMSVPSLRALAPGRPTYEIQIFLFNFDLLDFHLVVWYFDLMEQVGVLG